MREYIAHQPLEVIARLNAGIVLTRRAKKSNHMPVVASGTTMSGWAPIIIANGWRSIATTTIVQIINWLRFIFDEREAVLWRL